MAAKLTLGPLLFHWDADKRREFYFQIADEAPVDTVYLGEVVCAKRAPFFEKHYEDVAKRLTDSGKTVVFSSLAEVMTQREREMTKCLCDVDGFEVEANDATALYTLRGKPHRVGQYVNVFNEDTLTYLNQNGATHFALPSELPADAMSTLGEKAKILGVTLEVQVYGRIGLALSARCYHARSHGSVKDNCQLVCEDDPDGLELQTLDQDPFLAVNGIQTLSYSCTNLMHEMKEMEAMGISHFRLSPHSHDMIEVAKAFRDVLDGACTEDSAFEKLGTSGVNKAFSNGFYYKKRGHAWISHSPS